MSSSESVSVPAPQSQSQSQRPTNVDQEDWDRLQGELKRIGSSSLTPDQLMNATPDQLGNDPSMEIQWAMKAGKHAETYMKMLNLYQQNLPKLKLTPIDNEIYKHFRDEFPTLDVSTLNVNFQRQETKKWQLFVQHYSKNENVNEFAFGTLLRLKASDDYNPDNVIVVTRIIFIAIELARNREKYNEKIAAQPFVAEDNNDVKQETEEKQPQ